MKKFNNIILFAGEPNKENIPLGYFSSLATIPLRGKPIIWWQLENLKQQGIDNTILVLNRNNTKIIKYAMDVLSNNFNIKIVLISGQKSILGSFKQGLKHADIKIPTRVILGDSLIIESFPDETDLILTSSKVGFSDNWCLLDKNESGIIERFYDKQKNINTEDKETVVGYYSFSDTRLIYNCSIKARLFAKKEISDAMNLYKEKISLKAQITENWYDLGHTSGLIEAKNVLFNARSFNKIHADTSLGLLSKVSTNIQKLENEALWYKNIPDELKILTPRLISFSKNERTATLVQELYGYPSLAELFLSGDVNLEDWKIIIEKLFSLHSYFEKFECSKNDKKLNILYYEKTRMRIDELKNQHSFWGKVLGQKTIWINKTKYINITELFQKIESAIIELIKTSKMTIVHGDYCFSNILFDASNYTFKLIDPRGHLNEDSYIYGDPRYDFAKLRHSICGLYDFIVNGLFKIEYDGEKFNYKIFSPSCYSKLIPIFDELISKIGLKINDIKLIEGLLFLSMIPLHKDDFNRQKVMYLHAVIKLNEALEDNTQNVVAKITECE